MSTILKRCADELDQISAEIASGSPSKRQRKELANHQMVLAKAVRAVCDHQEQVASTKENGNSKYVLSALQAEERRSNRAAGILSRDRSETRKELLQFCRQQSDLGELPTPIGLRQRKENETTQGKNTRHAPDHIADVRKRADALRQLKPNAKYTASWAIPQLASLPTEHNIRGGIIREWSADRGNGLCPVTQRQLQKRVQFYLKGETSKGCLDWNHGPGRPKLVPHDKVRQLVRDSREGESWGKEEVRKLLEEQAGRRVSDKSVRNLLGEFHYESQYSTDHAMYKLPSRETAENSSRRNQA
jgi:hypothetical protein